MLFGEQARLHDANSRAGLGCNFVHLSDRRLVMVCNDSSDDDVESICMSKSTERKGSKYEEIKSLPQARFVNVTSRHPKVWMQLAVSLPTSMMSCRRRSLNC